MSKPTPRFVFLACLAAALLSWSAHRLIYPDNGWTRVSCDDCHGTGSVEGKTCEMCGGIGTWAGARCVMCRGTGKRIGPCPLCGGTGDMWKEPPR